MALELCGKGIAGELTALIRIEDRRRSPAGNGLLHGLHAKPHIHGVGQPLGQHLTAVPIDHGTQIEPACVHAHVGDVHGPDLIGMRNGLVSQQIGVDLVLQVRTAGAGLAIQRGHAHTLH